jgi:hypothetical protein
VIEAMIFEGWERRFIKYEAKMSLPYLSESNEEIVCTEMLGLWL